MECSIDGFCRNCGCCYDQYLDQEQAAYEEFLKEQYEDNYKQYHESLLKEGIILGLS